MKNLLKDIIIVDFETTGFNLEKDEAVQIGFIVLDKNNLSEKASFVSWIKPQQPINPDMPGFKWATLSRNDLEEINKAPSLKEVAQQITKIIPDKYTLCAWNANFDWHFWKNLLKTVNIDIKPGGLLDLWGSAYLKLLNDPNYQGDYKSESVFQYFGAKPRLKHDALEDCRLEAMVLQKLLDK
ncbi:3'-5' exonuclease [Patescibacteria group bacterium]|nr:3'-5' exonuclease [Patescibacteria group bacterium]